VLRPRRPRDQIRNQQNNQPGNVVIGVVDAGFTSDANMMKRLTNRRRIAVERWRGLIDRGRMKSLIPTFLLVVGIVRSAIFPAGAQVNVTQEHNNLSRDGLYIDAAFTPSAAANLTRDLTFDGTISGNLYAQPLYIEGGPNGPMIIAVTESNNVYALDATTGLPIWSRTDIGAPVPSTPCGGFSPTGSQARR